MVGDGGDFLFVEGFGDLDEILDFVGGDDFVEAADGVDAEDAAPAVVFAEGVGEDLDGLEFGDGGGGLAGGHLEDASGLVGDDLEEAEDAGGADHGAGGEVGEILADVGDDFWGIGEAEQGDLVVLAVAGELLDGGGVGHALADDGGVGGDEVAHVEFEGDALVRREAGASVFLELAIESGAEGMFDGEGCGGMEVLDGLGEKEGKGADVDLHAAWGSHGDEPDGGIDVEGIGEGDQLVVDEGAEVGEAGDGVGEVVEQLADERLGGAGNFLVGFEGDGDGVFHGLGRMARLRRGRKAKRGSWRRGAAGG